MCPNLRFLFDCVALTHPRHMYIWSWAVGSPLRYVAMYEVHKAVRLYREWRQCQRRYLTMATRDDLVQFRCEDLQLQEPACNRSLLLFLLATSCFRFNLIYLNPSLYLAVVQFRDSVATACVLLTMSPSSSSIARPIPFHMGKASTA